MTVRRVLVTGGGGYIGTTLVPLLLDEGYEVTVLDRFFFGAGRLEPHERLRLVREDIRRTTLEHFRGIDAVIDLAALSNDPIGELDPEITWQINHRARARNATLAKAAEVQRYVLPSSCSVYGFQDADFIADEETPINPLTTYAKANAAAERDVLPLADDRFTAVVVRQATVYGYSPRMRFDLAINGMTYGAWKTGVLPVMRDGTQWRPMVHVRDTSRALAFMVKAPHEDVSGEIFNVGSNRNNYQVGPLADLVAATVPHEVVTEWYGDPDHRSYRVAFDKIESLGYRAECVAEDGVREICEALESGRTERTTDTITLEWYRQIIEWDERLQDLRMHGGLLGIDEVPGEATK